ncbi:MAG: Crp/Fnr family transcriptional regulator [Saprospiraceae bacterium]|jgi:CRP-like cAMP-binding protein|nr:Crp/Fnr family transcriptional regulator [Saprospiraceae bacterium]HRD82678.1 Crp/Fnr family transcriptional regulator [Saprospiraceae bacterium]HRF38407.1 Crp/Fnr family transcriptional regulator [Saprospiraceae bacterium]HRJ17144.1 Crp/Fnr family transcriptional regulator [Saprospiraceae bacterium]HRK79855.1 Crp/Fnr family transcriptional regulator [Saprospiraceae bacterium]
MSLEDQHALLMSNIRRHIDPTAEEEAYFLSLLQTAQVKKRRFLLQEGDVCRHSAFVTNGCLRSYTVDANGFEHILQFAPENWWIADMYSFISGQPGQLYIDALEDTELLLLSKNRQEQLYLEVPKFERFFRIIVENSLVAGRQRILDNMSQSAAQRYDQFCRQYPSLIHRLPQKQIAAYIGVTPEFLSKLRGEKARRK